MKSTPHLSAEKRKCGVYAARKLIYRQNTPAAVCGRGVLLI